MKKNVNVVRKRKFIRLRGKDETSDYLCIKKGDVDRDNSYLIEEYTSLILQKGEDPLVATNTTDDEILLAFNKRFTQYQLRINGNEFNSKVNSGEENFEGIIILMWTNSAEPDCYKFLFLNAADGPQKAVLLSTEGYDSDGAMLIMKNIFESISSYMIPAEYSSKIQGLEVGGILIGTGQKE